MAQSGFTPIQLYSSSTAAALPIAGNLAAGELAINTVDEKLYFKNSAGTVKLIAANVTPVANGGSAATTAAAARTNFGATTLGCKPVHHHQSERGNVPSVQRGQHRLFPERC